jgi:hypothetical protein
MERNQITNDFVILTASRRWGLTVKRTGHEWHSPCPVCGGRDRFWINQDGHYQCRHCPTSGWLDDDRKGFKPDPILMQKWKDDIQAEQAIQEKKNTDWQNGFDTGKQWRDWHDQMTQDNRTGWNMQGISNYLIDKYELGYIPNKIVKTDGGELVLPAYTIPIRNPIDQRIVNIQFRLDNPPIGVGKYRQVNGISAREFYAETGTGDCEPDAAIVLEGAKKAIVTYDHLEGAIQVVGLPGCSPSDAIVERLKHYSRIWIALDPGAERAAQRLKEKLPQARVMNLPGKPDDLFIGGMSANQFREYAKQGR